MKTRSRFATLTLLLAAGCVGAVRSTEAPVRRSQAVITAEEVRAASASNAYELVQTLRPGWLRTRGAQSFKAPGVVMIYHDQVRLGGPETLRAVPVSGIATVQFFNAPAATQRWGTGHTHGAIHIRTTTLRL